MATAVTSAGTNVQRGARGSVRDSSGIPYVLTEAGGNIQLWKGNSATPTSFSEVDSANNPNDANYAGASIAIDSSDVIHIAFFDNDTGMSAGGGAKYITVTSDTWGSVATVAAITDGTSNTGTAISIDSSDIPHVVYVDSATNMGSGYDTIYYSNRVGGSWNTAVEVEGTTATKLCLRPDITIDADDIPAITYFNDTDNDIGSAIGNSNNATSFTLFDVEPDTDITNAYSSIAVDSAGNHHICFTQGSGASNPLDLLIRKHNYGDAWTTWQTTELVAAGTLNNASLSLVTDGTDRYIFLEDTTINDVVYYTDAGGSWSSQTVLETGTYNTVRAKWGFWVDNDSTGQIRGGTSTVDSFTHDSSGALPINNSTYARGQSFTGDGSKLFAVEFDITVAGSPTGNAEARIYAHTGTFGSSSTGTGSPLATSSTSYDVSTLSNGVHRWIFSDADRITLANGTKYVVVVYYNGGTASNYLIVQADSTSPTHGGNACGLSSDDTTWSSSGGFDAGFTVLSRTDEPAAELDYTFADETASPDIQWNTLTLASLTNYTLTATQQSYTLTGQAANVEYHRVMAANQATFTLTGQTTTFSKTYTLTADQQSYTLTGVASDFARTYAIIADSGGFTLSGQAANFLYQQFLTADQQSYTLTGNAATLSKAINLTADQQSYTLTGNAAAFTIARSITAAQASFTLSGQAATLTVAFSLPATQQTYTLTGYTADFDRAEILVVVHGSFTLTGNDAALTVSRSLTATQQTYTLTGYDAALAKSIVFVADQQTYTLTGQDATLTVQRTIAATQQTYTLTGYTVDFDRAEILVVVHGSFTLTGQDAAFLYNKAVIADQQSYTLTGQATTFTADRSLTADQQTYTLTGYTAELDKAIVLETTQQSYTLTGYAVALTVSRSLTATQQSYVLTGQAVNLIKAYPLTADQQSYTLTGNATGITAARSLTASQATFTLSGQATGFTRALRIAADQQSYTLTGFAADFDRAEIMVASMGSFTLTGQATTLTYNQITNGNIKYWDGASWSIGQLKYWDGAQWQNATLKRWNGNSWEVVTF